MGKILIYRKREDYMLVFFIVLITIFIIYISGINIKVDKLEIEKNEKIKLKSLKLNIYFLLFNKIKLIKIVVKKEYIEKINFNKILNRFRKNTINQDRKFIIKNLSKIKPEVKKLNISAKLGLNNYVCLAYLVAILNILFSIIYAKISNISKKENYNYFIKPLQTKRFFLKISINCIINIKIANIINMIIMNRSEEDNERTSNRRFNGNSHEQYTRYGRRKYYYRSTN